MRLPRFMLFNLLLLATINVVVTADTNLNDTSASTASINNATFEDADNDIDFDLLPAAVSITCSRNLRAFTALTEFRMQGRTELLSILEWKLLKGEFMAIYNKLTFSQCDSYHRKLVVVDFVNSTNSLGQVSYANETTLSAKGHQVLDDWFHPNVDSENNDDNGSVRRRRLQQQQQQQQQPADGAGKVNQTDSQPGMSLVYSVEGTCRDCPVTDAGAFELYDDGFRRHLLGGGDMNDINGRVSFQIHTHILEIRDLQLTEDDDNNDCLCAPGVDPSPRAPGVQECVDLMNDRIPVVTEGTGLLQNITLNDLLQLDDLSSLQNYENEEEVNEEEEEEPVVVAKTRQDKNLTLQGDNVEEESLVDVECSSNLRTFTALTEFVLEGRSELLNLVERKVLKGEFMNIYNGLTTAQCDSFHRKLNVINFVNISNNLGESLSYESMTQNNETLDESDKELLDNWFNQRRNLQGSTAATNPSNMNTTDSRPSQSLFYEAQGTCRDCPTTDSGSFELYDEGFRRMLRSPRIQIKTHILEIRDLESDDTEVSDAKTDCVCVEGVEPTPRAPGVQECVNLMNERIPEVAEGTGLLEDVILTNLVQLDDLSELETENGTSTNSSDSSSTNNDNIDLDAEAGAEEEKEEENWDLMEDDPVQASRGNEKNQEKEDPLDYKIWSRSGSDMASTNQKESNPSTASTINVDSSNQPSFSSATETRFLSMPAIVISIASLVLFV